MHRIVRPVFVEFWIRVICEIPCQVTGDSSFVNALFFPLKQIYNGLKLFEQFSSAQRETTADKIGYVH